MEPLETKVSLRDFGQAFSDSLTGALAHASDLSWTASTSGEPVDTPELGPQDLCCILKCSGGLVGDAQLFITRSGILELGCRVAGASGEGSDGSEAGFKQAIREVKGLFSKALGKHCQVGVEVEDTTSREHMPGVTLEITLKSDKRQTQKIFLVLDSTLMNRLQSSPADRFSYPSAPATSANLGLVLDVELNVTLRFGQRQLTLREILDLNSGSVVELDRQVDEPVELVLDGRVVARGEAVIIDGNYGMRITQVVHPIEAS